LTLLATVRLVRLSEAELDPSLLALCVAERMLRMCCWMLVAVRLVPPEPIPAVAPDLAVEVLSEGNTEGEMQRKLRDYFAAGVRLVWYVDPRSRTAKAYTAPDQGIVLDQQQSLSGGEVLPGFELPLRDLFAELDRHAP
jgi:hypothetical protein